MTNGEKIAECLTALGLPGTAFAYPEGDAPAPPFFVYSVDNHGEIFADDDVWFAMPRFRVELLEKYGDADLESKVLKALRAAFGPVVTYEDWDETDHCKVVSYYFSAPNNCITTI